MRRIRIARRWRRFTAKIPISAIRVVTYATPITACSVRCSRKSAECTTFGIITRTIGARRVIDRRSCTNHFRIRHACNAIRLTNPAGRSNTRFTAGRSKKVKFRVRPQIVITRRTRVQPDKPRPMHRETNHDDAEFVREKRGHSGEN